jgi:hypothetical protein
VHTYSSRPHVADTARLPICRRSKIWTCSGARPNGDDSGLHGTRRESMIRRQVSCLEHVKRLHLEHHGREPPHADRLEEVTDQQLRDIAAGLHQRLACGSQMPSLTLGFWRVVKTWNNQKVAKKNHQDH